MGEKKTGRKKGFRIYLFFNRHDIDLLPFLNSIPADIFNYVIKEVLDIIYFGAEDKIMGLLKDNSSDFKVPFRKSITLHEDEKWYFALVQKNSYQRNVYVKQAIREYVYTRWKKEVKHIVDNIPDVCTKDTTAHEKRSIKDTFVFQVIKEKKIR